ncbi:hypothetical protein ACPUD8_05700 [Brevibacterium sp. FAM 25378]|uniref:hypothetical protein n=1 Tax=unclassified Brevibacterium TaxID=2614124 RepID=UPI003211CCCE
MPQLATDEQRRVRGHRHLRPGDRLRSVPRIGEPVRRHLQVQLHRRAGGFRGDIGELRLVALFTAELDADVLAAGVDDRVAQRLVAVLLGHPFLVGEELGGQRRQRADRHHLESVLLGGLLRFLQALGHTGFEGLQPTSGHLEHRVVELEVEGADLGLIVVIEAGEHLLVARAGLIALADEVELEFEPDRARRFEIRMTKVGIEELEILRELLPIQRAFLRRVPLRADCLTHRTSKPQTTGFVRGRRPQHHPDTSAGGNRPSVDSPYDFDHNTCRPAR